MKIIKAVTVVLIMLSGLRLFGMHGEVKRPSPASTPAPSPTPAPAKPEKKKKRKPPVVLPTFETNLKNLQTHIDRLKVLFPDIEALIANDDKSAASVKSCTDCGGRCPTCSAGDRAGSRCTNLDAIFYTLDEKYLEKCHLSFTGVAGDSDSVFSWQSVHEVVKEWDVTILDDKELEGADTWQTFVADDSKDVVEEWSVGDHLVKKDEMVMTEATIPEDARLAITLFQTMLQDYITRNKIFVESREAAKRTLEAFIKKPEIMMALALQAVVDDNLRLAGRVPKPLSERMVTVLEEMGIVASVAAGVASFAIRWYKNLTPTQVASLVVSTGVSLLAPQAKALQIAVICAEALRQVGTIILF